MKNLFNFSKKKIFQFQENAEFIDDCFQDGLVQATFENRHVRNQ